MPGVFRRELFPMEYVTEMPAAMVAENLHPASVRIRFPPHGPREFVVEAGPPAAGMELVLRTVKRRVAVPADIGTSRFVIAVFPGKGHLGSLVQDDPRFFGTERPEFHIRRSRSFAERNLPCKRWESPW